MQHSRLHGFSLFEVMISMALFIGIASSLLFLLQAAINTEAKTTAHIVLAEELQYVFTRVGTRIHASTGVTFPSSGSTSTSLTLAMASSTEHPTQFTMNDGTLYMARANGTPIQLSSEDIQMTDLSFTRLSGTPDQIRISITATVRNAKNAYRATMRATNTFTVPR